MNDNDYEMQVEDLIKAEEIKYEVVYQDEESRAQRCSRNVVWK